MPPASLDAFTVTVLLSPGLSTPEIKSTAFSALPTIPPAWRLVDITFLMGLPEAVSVAPASILPTKPPASQPLAVAFTVMLAALFIAVRVVPALIVLQNRPVWAPDAQVSSTSPLSVRFTEPLSSVPIRPPNPPFPVSETLQSALSPVLPPTTVSASKGFGELFGVSPSSVSLSAPRINVAEVSPDSLLRIFADVERVLNSARCVKIE